jgi:hypothetical protein
MYYRYANIHIDGDHEGGHLLNPGSGIEGTAELSTPPPGENSTQRNPMATAYQLRSSLTEGYQRGKPVRSRNYRQFIAKQASVVSGFGGCVACHTGPHAGNQKSSDKSCIPLTWKEHAEFDPDPRAFEEKYMLDVPNLIAQFNELFESQGGIY